MDIDDIGRRDPRRTPHARTDPSRRPAPTAACVVGGRWTVHHRKQV